MAITSFAGFYNARSYGYGNAGVEAGPLQVISGSTSTGTYTLTCQPINPYTSAGLKIPVSVTTPITIGGDSSMETITPTAVSTNNLNQLLITGTFTYAHGTGAAVSSGTYGLQEAINAAAAAGGGVVVVDAAWFRAGGSQATINAATLLANVSIQDNSGSAGTSDPQTATVTLTNAQILALHATPVELLPPPDANSFYLVTEAVFVNLNTGTAYTGGGVLEVGYGTAVTTEALTGTIAATFLTGPTATAIASLAGAQITAPTSTNSSTYLAQPIYINNATAAFAAGTGTLQVTLSYIKLSTT